MLARAACFVVLAAWIVAGPLHAQLLGGSAPLGFAWRMFHRRGLGVVEVRFERQGADGRRERLSHMRALGFASPWDAPLARRRIVGEDGLRRAVAELCARLAPGTDLRVHARLATPGGWKTLAQGERDACAGAR